MNRVFCCAVMLGVAGVLLLCGNETSAQDVLAGVDFHATISASFDFGTPYIPPLPADFFGPGSDPFDGGVPADAVFIDPDHSNADMLIHRMADGPLPIGGSDGYGNWAVNLDRRPGDQSSRSTRSLPETAG